MGRREAELRLDGLRDRGVITRAEFERGMYAISIGFHPVDWVLGVRRPLNSGPTQKASV